MPGSEPYDTVPAFMRLTVDQERAEGSVGTGPPDWDGDEVWVHASEQAAWERRGLCFQCGVGVWNKRSQTQKWTQHGIPFSYGTG